MSPSMKKTAISIEIGISPLRNFGLAKNIIAITRG
jgi:hypothetical protein